MLERADDSNAHCLDVRVVGISSAGNGLSRTQLDAEH
jgi:hypothetical protein